MGRKAKIIEKAEKRQQKKDDRQEMKTQNNEEAYQQKQQSKRQQKKEELSQRNEYQVLKEKLQPKFNAFKQLIQSIYKLKGQKSQQQIEQEINKKMVSIHEKLQSISSLIIREEVKSLQQLIVCQKEKTSDDIIKIKKAYDGSKASLQGANVFSEQQIAAQLSNIQKKIVNKEGIISKLNQFQNKSKTL